MSQCATKDGAKRLLIYPFITQNRNPACEYLWALQARRNNEGKNTKSLKVPALCARLRTKQWSQTAETTTVYTIQLSQSINQLIIIYLYISAFLLKKQLHGSLNIVFVLQQMLQQNLFPGIFYTFVNLMLHELALPSSIAVMIIINRLLQQRQNTGSCYCITDYL